MKAVTSLSLLRSLGLESASRDIVRSHGVTLEDVLLRRTKYVGHRRVSLARAHLASVLRWTLDLSYPEVGRLVGGLDHTSVMWMEKKWGAELERQHGLVGAWTDLENEYKQKQKVSHGLRA